MFGNLVFLILVLLIINLSAASPALVPDGAAYTDFLWGMGFILATYVVVALQNIFARFRGRSIPSTVASIELVSALAVYHFVYQGYTAYQGIAQTLTAAISLILYLFGLFLYHFTSRDTYGKASTRASKAWLQVSFLIPFTLPFIAFAVFYDLLGLIPDGGVRDFIDAFSQTSMGALGSFILTLGFMGLIMIFLPPVIMHFWRCKPFPEGPMHDMLQRLCDKAQFKHAGLKLWTVMNHQLTAAIIGIVPRFRYVMFTKTLLERLPPRQIEAILAHEMGHSYRRHLLIYPFVILGMMIVAALFFMFLSPAITSYFALHNLMNPNWGGNVLYPFFVFVPYALIIAVYFRLVFGFFSRNFERQADLHVFVVGVAPEELEGALDSVAVFAGHTHDEPSWHHYSVRERMDFLKLCRQEPERIEGHHTRVRRIVASYFLLLTLSVGVLFAPELKGIPFADSVSAFEEQAGRQIDLALLSGVRSNTVDEIIATYRLDATNTTVRNAVSEVLLLPTGTEPGLAEFYMAQLLMDTPELPTAIRLMTHAWLRTDFNRIDGDIKEKFIHISNYIIETAAKREVLGTEPLHAAMTYALNERATP